MSATQNMPNDRRGSRRRTRPPKTKARSSPERSYWSQHFDESHQSDESEDENLNLLSSSCDPRLSRAARSLVADWLQDYLKTQRKSKKHNKQKLLESKHEIHIYSLMEKVMLLNPHDISSSCPLWPPQKDSLWDQQEQNSSILSAKHWREKQLRKPSRQSNFAFLSGLGNRHENFYQCHLCQKIFSSQYYLDLHYQTHHNPMHNKNKKSFDSDEAKVINDPPNEESYSICPATDWCRFLPNCADRAFELEPHYGPGGHKSHARWETYWWKTLHATACTTTITAKRQDSCREMAHSCFGDKDEYWSHICDTAVACPNQFHALYFAAGHAALRHVHEWQDEWDEWTQGTYSIGWLTWCSLLLLLIGWYRWQQPAVSFPSTSFSRNAKSKSSSRLLRKKQQKKSSTLFGLTTWRQKNKIH